MKTIFLNAGIISAVMTVIISFLLMLIICFIFKQKYYKGGSPNLAQSITLSGNLIGGLVMITALLAPVREYLTIISANKAINSVRFYNFIIIGCVIIAFSYVAISIMESLILKLAFKRTAVIIELQENNFALAVLKAAIVIGLAIAFFSCIALTLQSFIPVPDIPVIR